MGHLGLVARCVAIFADQTAPNKCPSAPVPPPTPAPARRHAGHAVRRPAAGQDGQLHAQRPAAVHAGHRRRRLPGGPGLLGRGQLWPLLPHICPGPVCHVCQPGGWLGCKGPWLGPRVWLGQGAFRFLCLRPTCIRPTAPLAVSLPQAPSNAVCMWSVPTGLRPFAMSMSVVAIHVLGDVPSPPLLGALQGRLQDWRLRWVVHWCTLLDGWAAALGSAGLSCH